MKKKSYFLLIFILVIVFLATLIFVLNYFTGILDPYFNKIMKKSAEILPEAETFLFRQAFAGISIGTLILVLVLLIYPLLFPSVAASGYYRDFFFGLLTAVVFYITEQVQKILSQFKTVDILLLIFGMIIFTYILIEGVASLFRNKQKAVEFKSQAIANVLSGIVFSMILTIIKSFIVKI